MSTQKKEYVTVTFKMEVNGKFINGYSKTYKRGRETQAYTLDDFARIIFLYEHIYNAGSTYAMDGVLQEVEKMLPKKEGETAESVFQKYWVKLNETINQDFLKRNKGDGQMFPEEGDYLKYQIATKCDSFNRSPLPVKYGFLYWFYKYVMNESVEEIQGDLKKIPAEIKSLVDNSIVEKK